MLELQLKASNEKRNNIYLTLGGNNVNVIIISLYLCITGPDPSPEQQQIFKESINQVLH